MTDDDDVLRADVLRADEDGFGFEAEEAAGVGPAVGLLETFVTLDGLTSAIMTHWRF